VEQHSRRCGTIVDLEASCRAGVIEDPRPVGTKKAYKPGEDAPEDGKWGLLQR